MLPVSFLLAFALVLSVVHLLARAKWRFEREDLERLLAKANHENSVIRLERDQFRQFYVRLKGSASTTPGRPSPTCPATADGATVKAHVLRRQDSTEQSAQQLL